jgi:hypothetical protein
MKLSVIAASACALALAAAPAAAAAEPVLPQDFSAADQYVESVPTSGGPKPAKPNRSEERRLAATLPPAVKQLHGALREVAVSPALGAPQRKLRDAQVEKPSAPTAAVSAIGDTDEGRLLWLLLALVVITGAVTGTAAHRHLARRNAADA